MSEVNTTTISAPNAEIFKTRFAVLQSRIKAAANTLAGAMPLTDRLSRLTHPS